MKSLVEIIWEIQIGESTLWHLQSVKLFFTGYLRRKLSVMYNQLRAWVWAIKLERFRLIPLYSIFFNNKKEDRITTRGHRYIAEPHKFFMYMCD